MNAEQNQFQERLKRIYRSQDEIEPLVEGLGDQIPQKSMRDYYIKLQTIVENNKGKSQVGSEKIFNNKQEVDLENFYNKLPGQENSEVNKLLILGGAGVGKSTLMRYIAYKWGEGELWKDRFDFVYRVSLKTLLNQDWKIAAYNPDDLNDHELKCLVHYNLISTMSRKERQERQLSNMVWLNESLSERILLLVDGYDEVAHLQNRHDFKDIFEAIFEFKNIILTSRPSAITRELAEKFDRKIEISGLGNEGICQYLSHYFKDNQEKGKEFYDLLAKNPSIKEIGNIPLNLAMLCFIWAESESKAALQKISNMSDLYRHVVDHLGFRYFTKQQPRSDQNSDDLLDLWQGGKIQVDELQVLQHVAYRGLIEDGFETPDGKRAETLIIKGVIARDDKGGTSVQSSINFLRDKCANKNLTINSVYKYGLLKTEGLGISDNNKKDLSHMNIQAQSFSFIQSSFQEYLAAQYLVEQLVNSKEDQKSLIADFIARHRNEPRYGLLLKFMAGIFRATPGQKNEDLIKGIKIFWDAIVCNLNGALEFGIDAKVNLLMHLLSQAKDERGQIDSRIPNQELMVKLIDYQMLGGLLSRIDEWKASDYMSANLKEDLLRKVLNDDESWGSTVGQQLKKEFDLKFQTSPQDTENEILIEEEQEDLPMTARDRPSKGDAGESFEAFTSLINHFSVQEQEKVMKKLLQDIKKDKIEIRQRKIKALTRIFQSVKLNQEDSRTFIEILFGTIFDDNLGDVSLKGVVETVKASSGDPYLKDLVTENFKKCKLDPQTKNPKLSLESMTQLLKISDCGQDIQVMTKASNFAISMLVHPNEFVGEIAIRLINLIVDQCDGIDFIQYLFKSLTPLLFNQEAPQQIKVSEVICKLLSSSAAKARLQALRELARKLISSENDSIPPIAAFPILEVLERHFVTSDPQMMQEIIDKLIPQFQSSNIMKILTVSKMVLEIAKIYGGTNLKLVHDAIAELAPLLQNSEQNFQIYGFQWTLDFALVGGNSQIYAQVIKVFTPFLCNPNENIQTEAVKGTAKLFKASQEIDQQLFFETVNSLVPVLNSLDSAERNIASKSLLALVNECEISDVKWIKEIIDSIMLCAKEQEVAIETILSLVEMKENSLLAQEVIEAFTSKLSNVSPQFKPKVFVAIARLEKFRGNNSIEKPKTFVNELNLLLKDANNDIKRNSAKGILELLKIMKSADIELFRSTIETFILLMRNADGNLRSTLIFYITEIFRINGDQDTPFIERIIPVLVQYLQDSSPDTVPIQQDAIVGVTRLMGNCIHSPPNTQLAGKITNAFFRIAVIYHDENSNFMKLTDFVTRVIRLYNDSESQTRGEVIKILISHFEEKFIGMAKIISSGILELVSNNRDAQLFEKTCTSLNQQLQRTSEIRLQVLILELRIKLEVMNDDGNIQQRAQDLIGILRPYLKYETMDIRFQIANCLVDLISIRETLRDAKLIQDIVDIQNDIHNNEEYNSTQMQKIIMRIVRLNGAADQAFLKKRIFDVLVLLKEDLNSLTQASYLDNLDELLKLYGNGKIELIKEIVQKVTPESIEVDKIFERRLGGLLQRLSVHIMPCPEIFGEYLDHPNANLRQNFRAGVFNYFKKYLNRFSMLESLVSKSNIKRLTLQEINEKLFEGGLNEACLRNISSSLDLLKKNLEQQRVNLKLLIAKELDLVEIHKDIRIAQVAYIAIYRSEFSEYDGEKELPDLAREALNNFVKYFTKEKLQRISDNYDELENLAPPVHKIFCTKLYHRILADRVITPLEERMITIFLQQGLTTSLTNQGEVVFQDAKYQIEGGDIRFMLERIARVIVRYGQDLLTRQYKMNIPLFEKSYKEGGMQEAAIDTPKVSSLVDERIILRNDFWLLTSLKPLNTTSELILLEQRSAFGNRIVFKLDGENFKQLKENFDLEEVFGQYQSSLIYVGQAKRLSPLIGQGLVKNPCIIKFTDVEGPQVGQTSFYYQQELLGGGKEDRMMRTLSTKQDDPIRNLESQLETLDLQQPEKVALQEYYEGFIATFGSVYAVAHAIDSGMLSVEIEVEGKLRPVGLFTTLVALIPFGIGEKLSEGIENLALTVKQSKVKKEAIFMKVLAVDAVDLSDRVSKIALERIMKGGNRKEILDTKESDPEGVLETIQELVTSRIEQFKSKAIKVDQIDNLFAKEIRKSPAFRLGESQANEMIQEWFKFNHAEGNLALSPEDRRTKFIQLVTTQNNVRLRAKKNPVPLDGIGDVKPGCCPGCEIF